jgi:hypothetical protein
LANIPPHRGMGYAPQPPDPGWARSSVWSEPSPGGVAAPETPRAPERGLPGWQALLLLILLAAIGGLVDGLSGNRIRGGFNIALVVASIVAILVVRYSSMFVIVVSPPLLYAVASAGMLYVRSHGLHDRKVFIDIAANWLVYGFPAIAGATGAVLLIAAIRMLRHRRRAPAAT